MKNIKSIIAILFVACAICISCDSELDVVPESVINAQSFWRTEEDAAAGRNGMFNQFRSTFNDREFLYKFELRSGFWQFGESGQSQGWRDLFDNDPNATTTSGLNWEDYYKLINSANLVLKYVPDIEFSNESEKQRIFADAYFMRAFTYFALARFWGDVPIVTSGFESDDDPDLFPFRDPVAEVFTQIKADISSALNAIPDDDARDGLFASEAAINMLKADVYLWTSKRMGGGAGDLDQAETAINNVLANGNYALLDSYEEIFRNKGTEEIILEIFFDAGESQEHFSDDFAFQAAPVPVEYQNNPVLVGSGAQWFTFTDHYVDNYLLRDPLDTRAGVINQDFDAGTRIFRWINKYAGELSSGTLLFYDNTPIYRFAEAILFKAEILAAKNDIAGGVAELNKIAERAYGVVGYYGTSVPAPGNQEELEQAILDERLIEFGVEGKAWFDFIRFGKAFEQIPSLVGKEGNNQGNILLLPVANVTISSNPNISQTTGF